MKHSMLGLGLLAATAVSVPTFATAALGDCAGRVGGPITHVVRIVEAGYFPTTTYVCPGDTVTFVNGHKNWANFTIDWGDSSSDRYSGWFPSGATFNTMEFDVSNTMTNVRFKNLNAYPYYPGSYSGYISLGVAPWDQDDL